MGGGIYNTNSSSPILTNVTISGNSAGDYGGGMCNHFSSSPDIRNSIVWGNTAPTGPAVFNDSSTPVFSYSIVQGSGGTVSWDTTNFGTDGGDNLDLDPAFVTWIDPEGSEWVATDDGDYTLQEGSPAINTGNDSLYPANANAVNSGLSDVAKALINAALLKDLAGNPRKNGVIDMGAYEYQTP
jgi:hypothetical protein